MKPEIVTAIDRATVKVDASVSLPRARFALLVSAADDPPAKRLQVQTALAPLKAEVRFLSTVERRVLTVTFPDRVFNVDDARTFEAAHVLREAFDLEEAEPDLPTNFFPERDVRSTGRDRQESAEGQCFSAEDPTLNDKPRWALRSMRAEEAWAFSVEKERPDRGAGIVIAQPDTGVTDHPELKEVIQIHPRDILDRDDDPTDPLNDIGNPGHGTGTASVVVSRESLKVAGSAPFARHMPIRAIRSVVRITQVTVAEAVDWAVEQGAHVITMSLGGIPSFSLHRAIRRATAADVIVLAAAGNCVNTVVWPARYDDCIAVAAVNFGDKPWKGTCAGSAVDISAPGDNVFRALVPDSAGTTVGQGQGTSFAVALTAGVAALWLAHHGRANLIAAARERTETLQEMFLRLLRATARRPSGWDSFNMGAGIVDARALLEASLDLNHGLESAPQPNSENARSGISVQAFVLETLGEQGLHADLDWQRFGPEIATALLKSRVADKRDNTETVDIATSLSSHLVAAGGPLLKAMEISTDG